MAIDIGSCLASTAISLAIGAVVGLATGGVAIPAMVIGIALTGFISYNIGKESEKLKQDYCN